LREERSGVMRVGFIGAGRMGAPMVRRLVDAGHQVQALGRTDERRLAVTELGAEAVGEIAGTAIDADVVVVCVFTDEQVRQTCIDDGLLAAMRPGSVLVLHTTGSPNTARDLARRADGIRILDAPVSGGPHDIAAGRITVFVGGDDDAVERARPALACYADPILHVGPTGAGQLVKLVNNTLFAAQIGLVAEGVRLGGSLGIEESALLGALSHGSASSRALSSIAATGSASAFISMVGEFIGKDVAVVRETVAELGSDLGVLDAVVNAGIPHTAK
jgi:3-hydroxyisobutyrate dehydrogenase-like beta-hydroxyacid dehydrogenase